MSFISFPRQAATFSDLGQRGQYVLTCIYDIVYITIIFFVQNRTRQYFEWIIRTNAQGSSRFKFQDNLTKNTGVLRTYSDFYQIHVYIGSQCLYLWRWNNFYSKRNHPPLTSQPHLDILFVNPEWYIYCGSDTSNTTAPHVVEVLARWFNWWASHGKASKQEVKPENVKLLCFQMRFSIS